MGVPLKSPCRFNPKLFSLTDISCKSRKKKITVQGNKVKEMSEIKERDSSPLTHLDVAPYPPRYFQVLLAYSFCFHHLVIIFNAFLRQFWDFPRVFFCSCFEISYSLYSSSVIFLLRSLQFLVLQFNSIRFKLSSAMFWCGWSKQLNKNIAINWIMAVNLYYLLVNWPTFAAFDWLSITLLNTANETVMRTYLHIST